MMQKKLGEEKNLKGEDDVMNKVEIQNTITNGSGARKYVIGISIVVLLELTSVIDVSTTINNVITSISQEYNKMNELSTKVSDHLDRRK